MRRPRNVAVGTVLGPPCVSGGGVDAGVTARRFAGSRAVRTAQHPGPHVEALAEWWREDFPSTPFWQSIRERFMPPVTIAELPELRHTLCDHAAGNYRIFIGMAAELLMTAAQREITVLDEKLYLHVFAPPETHTPRRAAGAR